MDTDSNSGSRLVIFIENPRNDFKNHLAYGHAGPEDGLAKVTGKHILDPQ